MQRKERIDLIKRLQEQLRIQKIIVYFCGDRPGAPQARISGDAVRPLYDHLSSFAGEDNESVGLFLYSRGGMVDAPWRMVSMIREFCKQFTVIVPYKAYSATTLIAIGANIIIMGKKGELGPIDPILSKTMQEGEKATVVEEIMVEDLMSYINFIKVKAELTTQESLSSAVKILAERVDPKVLGMAYRAHSHIRLIVRKLLEASGSVFKEEDIKQIIDSLAEKIYFHGHGICRKEAKDIGLPVEYPNKEQEEAIWKLYRAYEDALKLLYPFDPPILIPEGQDEYKEDITIAVIESINKLHAFQGRSILRHVRQPPPQLNISLTLSVPGQPPIPLPPQVIQQLAQQLRPSLEDMIKQQMPIIRTEGRFQGARWVDLEGGDF